MRNAYPVSTIELNDKFLSAYESMVYLLGLKTDTLDVTGLYDHIDSSGLAFMGNQSGIPHIGSDDSKYVLGLEELYTSTAIIDFLKSDYLLKKYLGVI